MLPPGEHLWADRFEGVLEDIFELQDQVTESVVGAIAPQLERAEIQRAKQKPPRASTPTILSARNGEFPSGNRQAIDEALPLFHKAMHSIRNLPPPTAWPRGAIAGARSMAGWSTRRGKTSVAAQLARRAVELGKNDAVALTRGAHALGHFGGSMDHCNDLIDRALALDPNLAAAWLFSGYLRIWRGERTPPSSASSTRCA